MDKWKKFITRLERLLYAPKYTLIEDEEYVRAYNDGVRAALTEALLILWEIENEKLHCGNSPRFEGTATQRPIRKLGQGIRQRKKWWHYFCCEYDG